MFTLRFPPGAINGPCASCPPGSRFPGRRGLGRRTSAAPNRFRLLPRPGRRPADLGARARRQARRLRVPGRQRLRRHRRSGGAARRLRQARRATRLPALKKQTRVLATWDDHDYGNNDAGAEFPLKEMSKQIFLDFFGVAKDSPAPRARRRLPRRGPSARPAGACRSSSSTRATTARRSCGRRTRPTPWTAGATCGPPTPRPPSSARSSGPGSRSSCASPPRSASSARASRSWTRTTAARPGRTSPSNARGSSRCSGAPPARFFISGDRHFAELSMMDSEAGYPIYDLTSSSLNWSEHVFRMPERNRHRRRGAQPRRQLRPHRDRLGAPRSPASASRSSTRTARS